MKAEYQIKAVPIATNEMDSDLAGKLDRIIELLEEIASKTGTIAG